MTIADRIQELRKIRGLSQEEFANKIGVSRQAVSKWESEQSIPDIKKIILIAELFEVTTDYLIMGIEPQPKEPIKEKIDAKIFMEIATALNFIGLIVMVMSLIGYRDTINITFGLSLTVSGCIIFVIGQFKGKNKNKSWYYFGLINVWILSFIPITIMSSLIVYFVFCILFDLIWVKRYKKYSL